MYLYMLNLKADSESEGRIVGARFLSVFSSMKSRSSAEDSLAESDGGVHVCPHCGRRVRLRPQSLRDEEGSCLVSTIEKKSP